MKRWQWICLLAACVPATAAADHIDWNRWYDREVEVRLSVKGGEGVVVAPGEAVRIEFKTNADAYHLIYGIDTDGYVRVLFPRFWEDDGWVPKGQKVKLRAEDLAWPSDRWGADGIVYIEAVASPLPFEFHAAGLVYDRQAWGWYAEDRPLRVVGDPFLAFNDIHQRLFPDWERAVFTIDYTYFYVGQVRYAPRYLGYEYERVYVRPPYPGFYATVRFGWRWECGFGYSRPIYRRYYRPGRHVVHHDVFHHHHVVYPERERNRRVVHDVDQPRRRIDRDPAPRRRVPPETKKRVGLSRERQVGELGTTAPATQRRPAVEKRRGAWTPPTAQPQERVVTTRSAARRADPAPQGRAVEKRREAWTPPTAQPQKRSVTIRPEARRAAPKARVERSAAPRSTPSKAPQRRVSPSRKASAASPARVSKKTTNASRAAVKSKPSVRKPKKK